jgi:hypothetical protein
MSMREFDKLVSKANLGVTRSERRVQKRKVDVSPNRPPLSTQFTPVQEEDDGSNKSNTEKELNHLKKEKTLVKEDDYASEYSKTSRMMNSNCGIMELPNEEDGSEYSFERVKDRGLDNIKDLIDI